MDHLYSQDCTQTTERFSSTNFNKLSPEDKATHRRWRRAVLAFYSCLLEPDSQI